MDYIEQYRQLIDIKPDYHKLEIPYFRASKKRFVFNTKELELWRSEEFGVFRDAPIGSRKEGSNNEKIMCLFIDS
jgi:hypothetical protein